MVSTILIRITEPTTIFPLEVPYCPYILSSGVIQEDSPVDTQIKDQVWRYLGERVGYSLEQDQNMEYFIQ